MMSYCQFQATPYAAELMEKLHLSEQQYATIATAPMLVGVVLSLFSGSLADRYGVKRVVLLAMILTTVGALGRGFAGNYIALLLASILMGVAGVVLGANNAKIQSTWFPPEQIRLAIGVILAAGNGGTVLAMLIGKSLSPDVGTAFLYGGIVFAVLTVLWLLFAKEHDGGQREELPKPASLGEVLKSRHLWLAALAAAAYMGINVSISALLSPGLIARGVSDGAAGATVIVFSVVALLSSIVMPGIIGKFSNIKLPCALLSLITGVSVYFAWHTQSDALRNVLIAVTGWTIGGLLPTIMSIPTILPEIGPSKIGAAGGLITAVMMGGAFLIPSYVITPLAGGINDTAFLIVAAFGIILAAFFQVLPNANARMTSSS